LRIVPSDPYHGSARTKTGDPTGRFIGSVKGKGSGDTTVNLTWAGPGPERLHDVGLSRYDNRSLHRALGHYHFSEWGIPLINYLGNKNCDYWRPEVELRLLYQKRSRLLKNALVDRQERLERCSRARLIS
jgi:hypothetical protein